ncbi:MAG: EMC3/TMCO1 family protein, partial [Nanoarchaeota archaeon]
MTFLDTIFNPVFLPLLELNVFVGIIILSALITLVVTLGYKYFSNQDEMKRLKERQKEFQAQMKSMRDKPEEMMKVQKEAMSVNFEYMKHSFKPMLITMLPVLIIFSWMAGHLSYEPIYPGESFSVSAVFKEGLVGKAMIKVGEGVEVLNEKEQEIKDGKAMWSLRAAKEGDYNITVISGTVTQSRVVLVSKELKVADALNAFSHSDIEQINVNYAKLRPLGDKAVLFG